MPTSKSIDICFPSRKFNFSPISMSHTNQIFETYTKTFDPEIFAIESSLVG